MQLENSHIRALSPHASVAVNSETGELDAAPSEGFSHVCLKYFHEQNNSIIRNALPRGSYRKFGMKNSYALQQ